MLYFPYILLLCNFLFWCRRRAIRLHPSTLYLFDHFGHVVDGLLMLQPLISPFRPTASHFSVGHARLMMLILADLNVVFPSICIPNSSPLVFAWKSCFVPMLSRKHFSNLICRQKPASLPFCVMFRFLVGKTIHIFETMDMVSTFYNQSPSLQSSLQLFLIFLLPVQCRPQ